MRASITDQIFKTAGRRRVTYGSEFAVLIKDVDYVQNNYDRDFFHARLPEKLVARKPGGILKPPRPARPLSNGEKEYQNRSAAVLEARLKTHYYYVWRNFLRPVSRVIGKTHDVYPWLVQKHF